MISGADVSAILRFWKSICASENTSMRREKSSKRSQIRSGKLLLGAHILCFGALGVPAGPSSLIGGRGVGRKDSLFHASPAIGSPVQVSASVSLRGTVLACTTHVEPGIRAIGTVEHGCPMCDVDYPILAPLASERLY